LDHEPASICVRLTVQGRVQGVGYRAWLHREASGLGLSGWVCNRLDGSVEAIVQGPPSAVDQVATRARRGPPGAVVVRVLREAVPAIEPGGFAIGPTR